MSVRRSHTLATAVLLLTLVACTPAGEGSPPTPGRSTGGSAGPSSTPSPPVTSTPTATPTPTSSSTPTPTPRPTTTPRPAPTAGPVRFDADAALADIRRLATGIGPRLATSQAFAEAADLVDDRFTKLGYRVRRTEVRVPAGDSWGVPVKAGTSQNLIAEPAGFDQRQPHIVIGAHLDTVAVAPGAEDNASGVSVLLELARMAAAKPPGTPVQFIAFGAEEPRGPADDEHHFGSQQHVANLSKVERNAVVAMVALDRVGVRSSAVPVCRSPIGGRNLRSDLRVAARTVDIPTRACELTTSDHWSYAKAGIPAARLGSVDYDEYHSRRDTFRVVDRRQLDRVGRVMWSWLNRG